MFRSLFNNQTPAAVTKSSRFINRNEERHISPRQRNLGANGSKRNVTPVQHSKSAHNFVNIPIHASPVIQPKLQVNTPGDKYEKVADAIADKITDTSVSIPSIQQRSYEDNDEKNIHRKESSAPVTNQFASNSLSNRILTSNGRGSNLDNGTKSFMSGRFGVDFGKVKIHTDAEAVRMNQKLNAKAFTVGNDIYFNNRQYNPSSTEGKQLLAHELTHTLQQGQQIRRRPMPTDRFGRPLGFVPTPEQEAYDQESADIRENLFEILRNGFPGTKNNEFVKKQIDIKFDEGTDDHWLATHLMENGPEVLWPKNLLDEWKTKSAKNKWEFAEGTLARTAGHNRITSYFFPGQTDNNALVIAGVHGSELSGTEVVDSLIEKLKKGPRPFYNVIIVPSLFPDNAEVAKASPSTIGTKANTGRLTKDSKVDPNREFPEFGKALDPSTKKDAKNQQIEPENIALLELIERFRPARIASIHSTHEPSNAGIYADPRADAKGKALGYDSDKELASAMAVKASEGKANVPGNKVAGGKAANTIYPLDKPAASAGSKQERTTKDGHSLGGWGSTAVCDPSRPAANRPAMRIITVEVQNANRSSDVTATKQAARKAELEALATSLQEIFLGPNNVETPIDPCADAPKPTPKPKPKSKT